MLFNEACEKAIKSFTSVGLAEGIETLGETNKSWYFIGGLEDKNAVNYCTYVLKIDKQTGEQKDMSMGPKNREELESANILDIPEKYRIKYVG